LQPLVVALKTEVLKHRVLHGDETPVAMLKAGNSRSRMSTSPQRSRSSWSKSI
jgi:hypothetical protein